MSNAAGCLVLAAGASRRFGSPKLLHTMADGRPLIQHTLQAICKSGLEVVVVHKPNDTALINALTPFNITLVENNAEAPNSGMGTSIAAGVAATPHWQGWLICLSDMPFIKTETYKQLATCLQHHPMVIPCLGNQKGHPRGFQHSHRQALLNLKGDQGPKQLIQSSNDTYFLPVEDSGVIQDIDRPEDLI